MIVIVLIFVKTYDSGTKMNQYFNEICLLLVFISDFINSYSVPEAEMEMELI